MKKLFALILALILVSSAAVAEGIDLSGLSFDELLELQQRVNEALWASDGWNHVKVPSGYFEIGSDIPAGRWTITTAEYCSFICFYHSLSDALADERSVYYQVIDEGESYSVIIEDGMGVEIDGAVYFSTYAPSFSFD